MDPITTTLTTTLTTNGIDSLAINLVSGFFGAIFGAVFTLVLQETWRWRQRPRLEIAFEERDGVKPYVHEFPVYSPPPSFDAYGQLVHRGRGPLYGPSYTYKCLRLRVKNKGRRPAADCEAKMVVLEDSLMEPVARILHWARRDPVVYREPEKLYSPVNINSRDAEYLDLLRYNNPIRINKEGEPPEELLWPPIIHAMCIGTFWFSAEKHYEIQVTVFSSNAAPKQFRCRLYWDGTPEGFHTAVSKL